MLAAILTEFFCYLFGCYLYVRWFANALPILQPLYIACIHLYFHLWRQGDKLAEHSFIAKPEEAFISKTFLANQIH